MSDTEKKKLTVIYKEIMWALGFHVHENGETYLEEAGVKTPFTIKSKTLFIPTDEWLRNPDYEKTIPFHPLSENTRRKKSEVQERLTLAAANRVYQITVLLLDFLFRLAVDTDKHPKLTPEQREFLRIVPDANAKTLKSVQKLLQEKIDFKGKYALVNMYVKRNGLWKGEEFPRVCTASFPIMDEEYSPEKKIFEVPFLVRDRDAFFKVMRWIFPDIDTAMDSYSYGSRSAVAPNFHSLMMSFSLLAKDLNKAVKVFVNDFDELKGAIINMSWVGNMSSLNDYKNDIPPLDGNIGEANEDELVDAKQRQQEKARRVERRELRRDIKSGKTSVLRVAEDSRGSRFVRRDEPEEETGVSWRRSTTTERHSWRDRDDRDEDRRSRREEPRGRGRGSIFGDRDDRGSRFSEREERISREDSGDWFGRDTGRSWRR